MSLNLTFHQCRVALLNPLIKVQIPAIVHLNQPPCCTVSSLHSNQPFCPLGSLGEKVNRNQAVVDMLWLEFYLLYHLTLGWGSPYPGPKVTLPWAEGYLTLSWGSPYPELKVTLPWAEGHLTLGLRSPYPGPKVTLPWAEGHLTLSWRSPYP